MKNCPGTGIRAFSPVVSILILYTEPFGFAPSTDAHKVTFPVVNTGYGIPLQSVIGVIVNVLLKGKMFLCFFSYIMIT